MTELGAKIDFKILPKESLSIIGSSSKENPGELYTVDVQFNISDIVAKRNKRVSDIMICLLILFLLPIVIIVVKNKLGIFKNWYKVLFNKASWVGYNAGDKQNLPILKKGILSNDVSFNDSALNPKSTYQLNFIYAKDYSVYKDLSLIMNNFSKLGNS